METDVGKQKLYELLVAIIRQSYQGKRTKAVMKKEHVKNKRKQITF